VNLIYRCSTPGCSAPIGETWRPVVLNRHESPRAVVALGRTSIASFAETLRRQRGASATSLYCTVCIMAKWVEAGAPKPTQNGACRCGAPLEFAEDKRTSRCERCRQGSEGRRV
jgi:hypothetical protein